MGFGGAVVRSPTILIGIVGIRRPQDMSPGKTPPQKRAGYCLGALL